MDFLLNPNIAYLFLVMGTFLVMTALIIPGTGLPEIGALFCLFMAGYAVYHLSFNWWALGLLVFSLLPFGLAVRASHREIWLVVSIIGLTVGSIFFFPAQHGLISVNPILALVTSVMFSGFLWVAVRKALQAAQNRPLNDANLMGQIGQARTDINENGSVQVNGELWSARSKASIPNGSLVKVTGREGFVLFVEKENHS